MRPTVVLCRAFIFIAMLLVTIPEEAMAASVALSWTDASDNETGFKIERMPAGGSYIQLATVGSNVQTYTDINVLEGSSYCYRISAYNSYGTSAPSNSACVEVPVSSTTNTGTTSGTTGGTPSSGTSGTSGSTSTPTANTPAVSYIGGKWKNYKAALSMKAPGGGVAGVMFRYLDSDNYYRLVWDAGNSTFRLELRHKGVVQELGRRNGNGYIRAGRFYPVEISANDAQLTVTFGGRQIFSVNNNAISEGSIALYTSLSSDSAFDNVVVTEISSGKTLLQDDFRTGKINGWTIIDEATNGPSAWSASSNQLVQTSSIGSASEGGYGTFALYTRGNWTDYRMTLSMKSLDDDTIGVMFRYNDSANYYRFSWDNQEGFRRLEKNVNGNFTVLASDTVPYTVGRDYQLQIVAQGNKVQVSVDGQLIFSVTDGALPMGGVALYARYSKGAIFDNVLVEDIRTNDVLLWDDFNDGDHAGWTIIDDAGTVNGPSDWTVSNGTLVQSSNIGSHAPGKPGTFALY